jgi:hypothetical protein
VNRSDAGKLGWAKTKDAMLAHTDKIKSAARLRYAQAPKKCLRCEALIPYEQRGNRFCTASCAAFWANSKRVHPLRSCEGCGCSLRRGGKKFCSNTCQHKADWRERVLKIEATGEMPSTEPRCARRYLAEVHGWQCSICKITTWRDQPTPLVLDHVDGNSDNWRVTNLRLICPNCDAQTPTYKARNRGKGRFYRRQRYQRGQSY